MKCYLLVDFGSTYTKLTIVDIEREEIVLTSKAITTIEDDIMIGFYEAYSKIESDINNLEIEFINKLGCSSAAGGLKIVAIGLVPKLTSEAARQAALGAGARILATYSFELTKDDVEEFLKLKPEIILLSGGTDGGNKETILHNAKTLSKFDIKIPIVVAGNKGANEEISEIFNKVGFNYVIAPNVMPKLNEIEVDSVREIIRHIFMENIVKAKGLENAVKYIGDILMPTPAAVLNAAKHLSFGTQIEDGLGDLIIVDIGGATTDIHSIGIGYPSKGGVSMKGLEEPVAKRSVEGDLGMRYSASALYHIAQYRLFSKYLKNKLSIVEVESMIEVRTNNITLVPTNELEIDFDEAIAKICCDLAMERHAGYIETSYSPFGAMYAQYGKDLTTIKTVIGTGGVLIHSNNYSSILEAIKFDEENPLVLKPMNPQYFIDKEYILSAMGLLSSVDASLAIRIMKKYIIEC